VAQRLGGNAGQARRLTDGEVPHASNARRFPTGKVNELAVCVMLEGCSTRERVMARRRPARVRADALRNLPIDDHTSVIAGLSPQGLRAIAHLERSRFHPGAVAQALRSWSLFVRDPWHRLWDPRCGCGIMECCPDLARVRATLEAAAHALPARDARRFRARVAALDAEW
jgi:hypothetical protein